MNNPAASCEVSLEEFIDLIEASFEEFDPERLKSPSTFTKSVIL
jgi:hypothetical protein